MTPLSPEAVAQMVDDIIADRAIGMPDHGGWAWFGGRDHVYLATRSGGRHYVMDFVRKGMKSAQPRFQIKGCMHGAVDELTTYQVGDGIARGQDQAVTDPSVYRLDVSGIDHPDARRMQRIPDMERAVLTLAAENATLRADNERLLNNTRIHISDDVARAALGEAMQTVATLRASEAAALERVAELEAALKPFAFISEDDPDETTQQAWEIRYRDRFSDWIDFTDIENARAALTPTADKE